MVYRLELSKQAEQDFLALPRQIQQRLQPRIDGLAVDPRPPGVKKLAGTDNQYRLRVGDYRIVYAHRAEIGVYCQLNDQGLRSTLLAENRGVFNRGPALQAEESATNCYRLLLSAAGRLPAMGRSSR